MRILFASTQGAGHFGPLIPLIDACQRNGHETLIVGPPTLKARGYQFTAGSSPPDDVLGPLWGSMPSLPPAQGDVVVVGVIFARLNVDAMLPTLDDVIESWGPDLVVREASEFASAIAAEQSRRSARARRDRDVGRRARLARGRGPGNRRASPRGLGPHRRIAVSHLLPAVGRSRAIRRHAGSAPGGGGGAAIAPRLVAG